MPILEGMSDTNYSVINNEKEMQFEIEMYDHKAFLSYRFYKKNIAFMHTEVPEALAGKGIASALVKEAFSYAQRTKKMVMNFCPFVAGFLKQHPEYQEQIDPAYRGR